MLLGEVFRGRGGLQDFNRNLLLALSGLNYRCAGLLLNDNLVPARFAPGLPLSPCGFSPYRLLWKLRLFQRALFICLRQRPAFVLCGHVNLLPVCAALHRLTGTSYILIAHGIEIWGADSNLPQRKLAKAHAILSVSRYTKEQILGRVPGARVELICNAVDPDRFSPGPKRDRLLDKHDLRGKRVLLTVGRLSSREQYKGHEVVFQALPAIRTSFPDTVYLVLGSGDDEERLKAAASALAIREHVIFAGSVPDQEMADYYNLCDVFVMPSKGEGFGIVYLEALACGKPVIAGNCDGAREPLLDGRLGLLVDPDSPSEVAAAVNSIFAGTADRRLLDPTHQRAEVIKNFGPQAFQGRIDRALRREGPPNSGLSFGADSA